MLREIDRAKKSRKLVYRDILYSTPGQEKDETLKAGCSRVMPREEAVTWTQSETVHEDTIVLKEAEYMHKL